MLGAGRYDITFPANISRCAYLATVGDPGNGLVFKPNGVYTGSGPGARTVYIETKNVGGGLSAGIPFHLAVICPSAANVKIAVVGASGLPARGPAVISTVAGSNGTLVLTDPRVAITAHAARDWLVASVYCPVEARNELVRADPRAGIPVALTTAVWVRAADGQITARWNGMPPLSPPPGFLVSM